MSETGRAGKCAEKEVLSGKDVSIKTFRKSYQNLSYRENLPPQFLINPISNANLNRKISEKEKVASI